MFDPQAFVATLPSLPGVYCMKGVENQILYVGKAKHLKHRVASYFRGQGNPRIEQMVRKIVHIDITVTGSEKEALLLESALIKSLNPQYNVLFKDDKSYPYLFLSAHAFPRLVYFRGKQMTEKTGKYYGPFPSSVGVKEALIFLQKTFKLRQCDDVFFKHRTRPCLQYQIERCTAPCVGYISQVDYATSVQHLRLFLEGKQTEKLETLVEKMQHYAKEEDFESAALIRDQIVHLQSVLEKQYIYCEKGNVDVIGVSEYKGQFCLQLLYIRQGHILDSQSYFPKQSGEGKASALLRSFLMQFYLNQGYPFDLPSEIILSEPIEDQPLIAQALSLFAKKKVALLHTARQEKAKWLTLARENAVQALMRRVASGNATRHRWSELQKVLGLSLLNRIECFDVSHLQGEACTAACVVFNQEGPIKSEYRRYNITSVKNDDYAALEEVLSKRYIKCKTENSLVPTLIIVDGGKGQLQRAKKVMLEYQILDVLLMGIAKGRSRKPGRETLYVAALEGGGREEGEWIIDLPSTAHALHLLQHIRDEAHRFAIQGQRKKSQKKRQRSILESIAGVGVKRSQKLIHYFGGLQGLMSASKEAIAQVPGISQSLASLIYKTLHKH